MYITPHTHTHTHTNTEKHVSNTPHRGPPGQVLQGLFWGNLGSVISLIKEPLCFIKSSFYFSRGVSKMDLEGVRGGGDELLPYKNLLIFLF